jgi:hypothetical protein
MKSLIQGQIKAFGEFIEQKITLKFEVRVEILYKSQETWNHYEYYLLCANSKI